MYNNLQVYSAKSYLMSYQFQAGATEMIEKSSFPLEVKETLVKITSKDGDIVIYES